MGQPLIESMAEVGPRTTNSIGNLQEPGYCAGLTFYENNNVLSDYGRPP